MTPPSINKYSHCSDGELIELFCRNGDLNILGTLYQRYMMLVYGVCMKYLKNREESQDAAMQIFEILITDIPRFEIRNFKSWLYGVSRNFCLMKLRKEHSDKNRLEKNTQLFIMESTEVLHPIEDTGDEQLQQTLKACLEQLRPKQRQCVELFYYRQYCYKQIADELSFDENKVKSYIQNGKRNLKICIESKNVLNNVED